MTAVFVHGNPETPAVWVPLRAELERDDVVALRLPGFGQPAPPVFAATKEGYVSWLVSELEALDRPVDLVGHDWGGAFVVRIACTRPDLLRTWVSDVAGLLDPSYVWHDMAQVWQTPGRGEETVAAFAGLPRGARIELYEGAGMTASAAAEFVDAADDEMNRCMLALYRSAIQPAMADWAADAEAGQARPGLVVHATEDHFTGGAEPARRMAGRMGARFVELDGLGHWWMLHDPGRGARLLEEFWAATS